MRSDSCRDIEVYPCFIDYSNAYECLYHATVNTLKLMVVLVHLKMLNVPLR